MTDAQKPVIGFIGVGYMGHGMAVNILKGGYKLYVRGHRNRQPIDDLVGRGANEAPSPGAMAEVCDIIHLCLSNSPQVEAVIRGETGILASGKRGLVVIDTTTADPTSTAALAEELAAAGMTLVDAPLGRTPKEAEAGTLDAMVGADDATFERIRPVIECWASTITHVGPSGSAHRMKLVMNFIAMGYAGLYAEAVTLAAKAGVSPQIVNQVIGGSRLSNGFFETFMRYAVGRDRDAHKFTLVNASKDVGYAALMAETAGVDTPVGAAVRRYFDAAVEAGRGDDYVPMISDYVAERNGLDLARAVKDGEGR